MGQSIGKPERVWGEGAESYKSIKLIRKTCPNITIIHNARFLDWLAMSHGRGGKGQSLNQTSNTKRSEPDWNGAAVKVLTSDRRTALWELS